MPEAADPDHDRGGPRREQVQGSFHGVVGRQRRVGQGRCIARVEIPERQSNRACGTSMYSAMPPSRPRPPPKAPIPAETQTFVPERYRVE